jgi:hypothetical protein
MADSSVTLQSFTIAKTLCLVPLPPLLAALGTAMAAVARPRAAAPPRSLAAWCAAAALLSCALTLHAVAHLAALPRAQRGLFCHLAEGLRIGSLDASLALVLDSLAAPPLLAVSAIGAVVLVVAAISQPRNPTPVSALGASCLLLFAVQTMLLASGFVVLLASWSAATVAGFVLLGRRAVSSGAGIPELLLLGAAALLFWVYGGRWQGNSYVPELRPRVVAVPIGVASDLASPPARAGFLSLRALAGTRIGLSGAELCAVDASGRPGGVGLSDRPCREPAKSPFARVPIPNAVHDLHLFTGHGTDQLVVKKVRIEAGRETLLGLVGPTLDFRELGDQLLIHEPLGDRAVRRTLQKAELFGLPALTLAVFLLVLATALKLARVHQSWAKAMPELAPGAALVSGLSALAGVYALARLSFLVALTPAVAALGVVLGCAIAVRAAAVALAEHDVRRVALLLAGAHGGIAFGGAAAGAAESSVLYLAIASSAACAFALALGGSRNARSRARWLGAVALSGAPLAAQGGMLAEVSAAEELFLPGPLVATLLLAGSALISFNVWCGHYRAPDQERDAGDFAANAAFVLAVVALAGGLFAGYRQGADLSKAALAASSVVVLGGWFLARRQSASGNRAGARSPLMARLGAPAKAPRVLRRVSDGVDWIAARVDRAEQILYSPVGAATKPEGDR